MHQTCADISAARRDLGHLPSVTLEEGLEIELRWLREAALSFQP